MPASSTRELFVEAMRPLASLCVTQQVGGTKHASAARQVVEAFARVTYVPQAFILSGAIYEDENGELQHPVWNEPIEPTLEEWTAALLKECGL